MPLITFYGCKGGTGRTTAAASLALGFLAEGLDVSLVETDPSDRDLSDWAELVAEHGDPEWDLRVWPCWTAEDLFDLKRHVGTDPTRVAIIDTTKLVSGVRSVALEMANLVVMPFTSFIDAEIRVRLAAKQIPRDQRMIGLSIGADDDLCARVSEWMPVLSHSLPMDERLNLFSEASEEFVYSFIGYAQSDAVPLDTLRHRLIGLSRKAAERCAANMGGQKCFEPTNALTTMNAKLAPGRQRAFAA